MPYNVLSAELKNKIWLMYLRKSRQDDPNETVEEVLSKHQGILQNVAMRTLGREIPEDCIFREVVSGGESIDERLEIKRVLSRIEDPNVAGVLVVDPQRLTRGSLEDCGRIISAFRFTNTLIITERDFFDLEQQRDRKYFESELMRGRDYLEYVTTTLARGRDAAARRGNVLSSVAAFGYDKVRIGKDATLTPNKDADIVRMMFEWYVNEGIGYASIANRLDDMGIKPPKTDRWIKNTVASMLKNPVYDGKACYNRKPSVIKIQDGKRKVVRRYVSEDEIIIAEGKHPAIVDHELFMAAQKIINNHPRVTAKRELKNAFAGIMVCGHCKLSLFFNGYGGHRSPRIECRKKPPHFKSASYSEVVSAVIVALESSELPNLEALQKANAGNSVAIQQQIIKTLEEEMKGYREQEETQYELLETKKYTQELFDKRNSALRIKMEDCEQRIKKAKLSMPNAIDYKEKVVQLKQAIQALKDDSMSVEEQNKFLKVIIDRIELQTTDCGFNKTDLKLDIFLKL